MNVDLQGRRALVTGASSGLGAHFAALLARSGAAVAFAARRVGELERLARETGEGRAIAVALDVREPRSIRAAVDETVARLGGLDILVNNSGIAIPKALFDLTEDDWDAVIDTNLSGAWRVAQAAARVMRERGGNIVNIGSIAGLRSIPGLASYAASKAGLLHLTRTMAVELARYRIRVNALAPGYIETAMNRAFFATDEGKALIHTIPQRRLGTPEDLDGALLLLVSDASRFMTGAVIAVDGGHSL